MRSSRSWCTTPSHPNPHPNPNPNPNPSPNPNPNLNPNQVHNAEHDSPWLPSLEQADAMQLEPYHVGLADSQQVSEYLLHTFNDHSRPPRFGAQRILTLTLTLTLTVTSKPNPTP